MLASLLPGLRDVRTPLTVGYLWLLTGWLVFGRTFAGDPPGSPALAARVAELHGFFGPTVIVATVSFAAYVLGALLSIPVHGRRASALVRVLGGGGVGDSTDQEYQRRVMDLYERTMGALNRLEAPDDFDAFDPPRPDAEGLNEDDLRARLLVANQQMYGEYDRIAAEAEFRVNMAPPLLALGLVLIFNDWPIGGGVLVLAALVLFRQGATRLPDARRVLERAVLANVIKHPFEVMLAAAQAAPTAQVTPLPENPHR